MKKIAKDAISRFHNHKGSDHFSYNFWSISSRDYDIYVNDSMGHVVYVAETVFLLLYMLLTYSEQRNEIYNWFNDLSNENSAWA